MRCLLLVFAFLPLVSGCGALAVQPATPARFLDVRGLELPRPGERYYVMIFSSQVFLKEPSYTHTWATAVRVADGKPGMPPLIEHHTISWMPATLDIDPSNFEIERGINLGLHKTIKSVALANDERIILWGPYECRPALFTRFVVQKQFMESGKMGYQCIDSVGEAARTGKGCNCVHAISDMDPQHGRLQYPLTRYGFSAGREITRRLRELDALLCPERTHDFLIPAFCLNAYPLIRAKPDAILTPSRGSAGGNR